MKVPLAGVLVILAVAVLVLDPPAARGQGDTVYRWTDGDGAVHFTQGLGSVPEQYRSTALPLGSIGGVTAPTAAPKETPGTPPPPPPPPGSQLQPPPPNAPERLIIDEAYSNARTTDQYLAVGKAYLRFGLPLAAKSAADKAGMAARTSAEWSRVADAYDAIGQVEASKDARSKAEQFLQQERALGVSPR